MKLCAPSFLKAKVGYSNHLENQILMFIKLSISVGFNYPSWLGPKDRELHALLVPKATLISKL